MLRTLMISATLLIFSGQANAVVLYDEFISGDLGIARPPDIASNLTRRQMRCLAFEMTPHAFSTDS